MKARFSGSCGRCFGRVEPGDEITRDGRSRRWVHRSCPSGGERPYRRVGPNEAPTVEDYSHWNEEAAQVWWAENRYDFYYGGGE